MMARCLEGGGLPVVKMSLNDSEYNIPFGNTGYIPNPNGFYSIEGYMEFDFPTFYEEYKGQVLKIPRTYIRLLPPGKYKLIFMNRDEKEILASYRSFIGLRDWGEVESSVYLKDVILGAEKQIAAERGDIDIIEVNYNELMRDPRAAFDAIVDFGVPIDPAAAAALVDPALYRHRLAAK